MTSQELKTQIDLNVTDKTSVNSITPANVGGEMKAIVDYIDSRVSTVKVSLTADQINNIGTTPLEAVPAPGLGKVISLIQVLLKFNFGSVAFDVNLLKIGADPLSPAVTYYMLVDESVFQNRTIGNGSNIIENAPVIITGTDSVAVGDSTIDLYITYRVITL